MKKFIALSLMCAMIIICGFTLGGCFETKRYQLTLNVNNPTYGSVSGAGIYDENEEVQIGAIPYTGYKFVNWTQNGTEISKDAEVTIIMTKNKTLVANFAAENTNPGESPTLAELVLQNAKAFLENGYCDEVKITSGEEMESDPEWGMLVGMFGGMVRINLLNDQGQSIGGIGILENSANTVSLLEFVVNATKEHGKSYGFAYQNIFANFGGSGGEALMIAFAQHFDIDLNDSEVVLTSSYWTFADDVVLDAKDFLENGYYDEVQILKGDDINFDGWATFIFEQIGIEVKTRFVLYNSGITNGGIAICENSQDAEALYQLITTISPETFAYVHENVFIGVSDEQSLIDLLQYFNITIN